MPKYETPDGPIGLLHDDDLHNAVEHARANGCNFLNVYIRTQDDIGCWISLPLSCGLIREQRTRCEVCLRLDHSFMFRLDMIF